MTINRLELKENSKSKLSAANPSPTAVTLGYLVISLVLTGIQGSLDKRFDIYVQGIWRFTWEGAPLPALNLSSIMLFSVLFILLLRIISSVLSVGYSWYGLRISRSLKASFANIFDPMNAIFKVIGLTVVIAVLTFLWSLLLFIPGIIASYRYRQAYYILFDHPEYGIMQCIRESKRMMRGYKTDLFVLDLSFIGWIFLCTLTLGILFIWKLPYFEVTYAGFYNSLRGFSGFDPRENYDGANPWGAE